MSEETIGLIVTAVAGLIGGGFAKSLLDLWRHRGDSVDKRQETLDRRYNELFEDLRNQFEDQKKRLDQCEKECADCARDREGLHRKHAELEEVVLRIKFGDDSGIRGSITSDDAGIITDWNQGAMLIFGWTYSQAVGRSLSILIPGRYKHEHFERFTAAVKEKRGPLNTSPRSMYGLDRIGREIPITVLLSGHFHGITGRWQYTAEIERRVIER